MKIRSIEMLVSLTVILCIHHTAISSNKLPWPTLYIYFNNHKFNNLKFEKYSYFFDYGTLFLDFKQLIIISLLHKHITETII